MHQLNPHPSLLDNLSGKTAIITGAARGIGAGAVIVFNKHGANVVIADLPQLRGSAEDLIKSLENPERAVFIPADITNWKQMVSMFEKTIVKFGKVDMVVANAGIMESTKVLHIELDDDGLPMESNEALRVFDVNLKGAMNTLRLGLHYLSRNPVTDNASRGSITLVTSTSGYFGTTGNAAYIASKHGVVGLLRGSQQRATEKQIRLNSVAPCFTPTFITAGLCDGIEQAGIESNTPEMVGEAIAFAAVDEKRRGTSCLVAGKYIRELEHTRNSLMGEWLGEDLVEMLGFLGRYLTSIGGFRLPPSPPS